MRIGAMDQESSSQSESTLTFGRVKDRFAKSRVTQWHPSVVGGEGYFLVRGCRRPEGSWFAELLLYPAKKKVGGRAGEMRKCIRTWHEAGVILVSPLLFAYSRLMRVSTPSSGLRGLSNVPLES